VRWFLGSSSRDYKALGAAFKWIGFVFKWIRSCFQMGFKSRLGIWLFGIFSFQKVDQVFIGPWVAAQEVFSWVTLEVGESVAVRGATQGLFFIRVKEKISRGFIEFAVWFFKIAFTWFSG